MATKDDIIALIQAVADATGVDAMRVSLGAPGNHVEIGGSSRETGAGWSPEPKPFPIVIEGLAQFLDGQGVGSARFNHIQQLSSSGVIAASTDLAELTAAGITASLPATGAVANGTQIVVKNQGFGGNFLNVDGGGNIDAGPVLGVPGIFDAVRVYKSGGQWWTW